MMSKTEKKGGQYQHFVFVPIARSESSGEYYGNFHRICFEYSHSSGGEKLFGHPCLPYLPATGSLLADEHVLGKNIEALKN